MTAREDDWIPENLRRNPDAKMWADIRENSWGPRARTALLQIEQRKQLTIDDTARAEVFRKAAG